MPGVFSAEDIELELVVCSVTDTDGPGAFVSWQQPTTLSISSRPRWLLSLKDGPDHRASGDFGQPNQTDLW